MDTLGKMVNDDVKITRNFATLVDYFRDRQGRGNFTDLRQVYHPAKRLLRRISRGAPVVMQSSPWSPARVAAAVARGPHKSAYEFQEFLRAEMADMVEKALWTVLPYHLVKHLKKLRVSPVGVVPQWDRRPRIIVDYTYSGVNGETLKLSPQEAMQFGRALERIITQVVRADPRYGPVKFIKIDLADGFYRVFVRAEDIPTLGVAFPSLDGEEPIIAFPLVLPMGWTESPPYFCAATETIADMANDRILTWQHPPLHKLDRLASSLPPIRPPSTKPEQARPAVDIPPVRDPNLPPRPRILGLIDIFVDDFIGAAQGSTRRLNRIRRILMHAIDEVFRPSRPRRPPPTP